MTDLNTVLDTELHCAGEEEGVGISFPSPLFLRETDNVFMYFILEMSKKLV